MRGTGNIIIDVLIFIVLVFVLLRIIELLA